MAENWFYAREQKCFGPVSTKRLKELVAAGKVGADDMVRRDDMGKWIPARKVVGLLPAAPNGRRPQKRPPPLPPPLPQDSTNTPFNNFTQFSSQRGTQVALPQMPYPGVAPGAMPLQSESFEGKAIWALLLLLTTVVPGMIASFVFYSQARDYQRRTRLRPDGFGLLQVCHALSYLYLIFGVVIVICIVAVQTLGTTASSTFSNVAVTLGDAGPSKVIAVTAPTLVAAYEANEVAADARYKDELLEIKGVVTDIKRDIMNTMYVTLSSGNQFGFRSVQCFFDDRHVAKATRLRQGEVITVRGRCDGLMMNVLVNDCVFVDR